MTACQICLPLEFEEKKKHPADTFHFIFQQLIFQLNIHIPFYKKIKTFTVIKK